MPGIAVISMDNYNDGSKVVDSNFDGEGGMVVEGGGPAWGGGANQNKKYGAGFSAWGAAAVPAL